jgi:tRNA threonylcarbamoyladenosine biosynthesis protein TsaE
MIITNTNIDNLDDLKSVAKSVASEISVGSVICLTGDLGVGKTMFTKFLISEICGCDIEVNSPTFNILQIYDADLSNDNISCNEKKFQIYHYDFYRLKDANEVINLDLEYAVQNAITIIEWPQIANDIINSIAIPSKIIRLNLYFENGMRNIVQV